MCRFCRLPLGLWGQVTCVVCWCSGLGRHGSVCRVCACVSVGVPAAVSILLSDLSTPGGFGMRAACLRPGRAAGTSDQLPWQGSMPKHLGVSAPCWRVAFFVALACSAGDLQVIHSGGLSAYERSR